MKKVIAFLTGAAILFGASNTGAAILFGASNTGAAKKVHSIGDSTMANYDESATVTRGWGQYLSYFLDGIEVNNRGKSGSSSKSFYREEAYWTSVKKQLSPGDYVLIQFAHNDEKNGGMDGDEVKAYYSSIGDETSAAATDYRGTNPTTTYKEYLRKYIDETRDAGCTPILVGPICRMYFSGNNIRRNGRHDLGDSFSRLTADGILTEQKVAADDHSMDYAYQMQQVAAETGVPYIDLTSATAELYLSYGQSDCMAILSDGDGSTHLSATGAALIARRFVQLCKEQEILSEYVSLNPELSVAPSSADLGNGYVGQTLSKEFMVTGFDLTPASGTISLEASDGVEISIGQETWGTTGSMTYNGGTLIGRFQARIRLANEGLNSGTVTLSANGKSTVIPVSATAITLSGDTEVEAYWRLEKDDTYTVTGPVSVIPESWHSMEVQRYANPNANTTWPEWTGFDASRKTQRNLIEGGNWPAGEIDEVSTRYIEFGITAMPGTTLDIDEISYFMCGCGGNGMCVHVWYSTEDDFSNAVLIYSQTQMPANNMLDGKVQPVIRLTGGKSLRLRFYPWYNNASSGKTFCLSDVRFHGYATQTGGSGIDGTSSPVHKTGSAFYNLQGIKVHTPVKGNLYIEHSTFSDGSSQSKKIIF